ncbi:MAG: hypothetical protein EWM72_01341 [Nitrospira sp.]|nr:MAG: hypothetical protein EWM72_01341 [Nitrospira sp.]
MALVSFNTPFPSFDFLGPFARRKTSSLVQRQNNLHSCVTNAEHRAKSCYFPTPSCPMPLMDQPKRRPGADYSGISL